MTAALPTDHVDRADDLRHSLPPARHPALVRRDLHHHGEEGAWWGGGPSWGSPAPRSTPSPRSRSAAAASSSQASQARASRARLRGECLNGAPDKPLPRSLCPGRLCSVQNQPVHPALEPQTTQSPTPSLLPCPVVPWVPALGPVPEQTLPPRASCACRAGCEHPASSGPARQQGTPPLGIALAPTAPAPGPVPHGNMEPRPCPQAMGRGFSADLGTEMPPSTQDTHSLRQPVLVASTG